MTPELRVSGKALVSLLFAEPFRRHGNKEAQLLTAITIELCRFSELP